MSNPYEGMSRFIVSDAVSPEVQKKIEAMHERMWEGSGEPGFDGLGLKSIYDGTLWQHMFKPSLDVSLPKDTQQRFDALQLPDLKAKDG